MYDILNHFYLDILKHLREMEIRRPIHVIFDRGYPSLELIDFLETEGIHYLMRLSSNDYKAERKQMQSADDKAILKHSPARLQKIRKKHPERYEHMKKKGKTTVRISRSTLLSGNEVALVTDLPDTIATEELVGLYYQRWEIKRNTIP